MDPRKVVFPGFGRHRIRIRFSRCHPEIVRELGSGMFGIVSLLMNGHALKRLTMPDSQVSIENEIACLARLSSSPTHIAPRLYSAWICPKKTERVSGSQFVDLSLVFKAMTDYDCYIEMEYLDAKELRYIPERELTARVVKTLIYKTLVLHYDYGIYHNDLHMGNVLYQTHPNGTVSDVFIVDYGFAAEKEDAGWPDLVSIRADLMTLRKSILDNPFLMEEWRDALTDIEDEIQGWFDKDLPRRDLLLLAYCNK